MRVKALVLIDHGSRRAEANALLEAMSARVAKLLPDWQVEPAHMELAEPTLAQAIARCVQNDAREIVVVPFFLGPGRHVTQDIPRLLDDERAKYPEVSMRLTGALAPDDLLAQLVIQRATEDA